jgi:hypothetical protein
LVVSTFVWAGIIRFQLPQLPLVDGDVPGYLNPALAKLAGLGFVHDHGRHFVYPGLVFLLLRIFGSLRAIPIFQHALGLLTGLFLMMTWERAGRLLGKARTSSLLFRPLGLLLTAIFLTATKPILFETQLRGESVFTCFTVFSLLLNAEFIRLRFLEHKDRLSLVFGSLSLFVAVLLHCLRPSWGFGVISASLPMLVSLFDRSGSIRMKCLLVGTSATLIVAFLILPEHHLAKSDPDAKVFGARVIFATHADFIRDQIGADLASGIDLPFERQWLASVQASLDRDIEKTSTPGQRTLGFDSEYIMWQDSTFNRIMKDMQGDPDRISSFCWYYYRRVLIHQPWRMTEKVFRQMQEFYSSPIPVYQRKEYRPIPLAEFYDESERVFANYVKRGETWVGVRDYARDTEWAKVTEASIPSNRWLSSLHSFLGYTYLPLLVSDILISLVICAVPRWRRRLGAYALFTLLIYSYNLGNCLTVAVMHTLIVRRYIFVQLAFTTLAQFSTIVLLIQALGALEKEGLCRLRMRARRIRQTGMVMHSNGSGE